MSHAVMIPDELYNRLSKVASAQGRPVERVVADLLDRELDAREEELPSSQPALDWENASADDIIATVRSSRVERT
ncbi:MAG: hypothetical protein ACRDHE_07545, partial [Ktedonobacterales bacterium]